MCTCWATPWTKSNLKLAIGRVKIKVLPVQSSKESKLVKKDTNMAIIGRLKHDESRRESKLFVINFTMDFRFALRI